MRRHLEQKMEPTKAPHLMSHIIPEHQAAVVVAEMDRKEEEEEQFAKYGEKYAKSSDDHWLDRHGENIAPELAEFCLNPEQSRSYYTRKTVRDWYDLRLSANPASLEPNTIYLSADPQNKIQYTLLDMNGHRVTASTSILVESHELTMRQAIRMKDEVLKAAIQAKQIHASPYEYYEGIPCATLVKSRFGNEPDIVVPEGQVGLAYHQGKPVFLAPGSYMLSPEYTLPIEPQPRLVATTNKHITHGTMHIIRVEGQAMWQVTDPTKMDDFRILTQGTHVIELPSGTVREVQDTSKQVLWVKNDEKEAVKKPDVKPEVKAEKPKEEEKVPAGRKPGRVIFVKVPQGKVAVCYDNEGQLRILKPGMFYLPPSWTFYDYISYKKNIEKVRLESIKSKDNITFDVEAHVRYQIIDPYHAVKEFGPNGIYKAIKDSAAEAVKLDFNGKSIVFNNQAQFDACVPAPAYQDYQEPPPDYDGSKAVQNMNAQLEEGKVKIHKVSIMKYTPSHPAVLKAIEEASAVRVNLGKAKAELESMKVWTQSQELTIAYLRKQGEVRTLEFAETKAQCNLMLEVAKAAVETAKILNTTPGAREIFNRQMPPKTGHAQLPDAFFNQGNPQAAPRAPEQAAGNQAVKVHLPDQDAGKGAQQSFR